MQQTSEDYLPPPGQIMNRQEFVTLFSLVKLNRSQASSGPWSHDL